VAIAKYFGAKTDSSGNPLFWPGTIDGFPFRGASPGMLKAEEYENITHVYDAKAAILYLPDDLERYQSIIDHCVNGWYQLRHERFLDYDTDKKAWPVFINWLEIYGHTPPPKHPYEAETNANSPRSYTR